MAAIISGEQMVMVAGLASCWRVLADPARRPSMQKALWIGGPAAILAGIELASYDSPVGALLTAPFVLIGSFVLGWLGISATERLDDRNVDWFAWGGLGLLLLAVIL